MRTCEYAGAPFSEPRSHPWLDTVHSPDCRYYDLTAEPARIRTSLEDLVPWSHFAAVQAFYTLLERVNHPRSALETNDCAFEGPSPNEDRSQPKAYQCSGRVMVLYRDLARNIDEAQVSWLKNELHHYLSEVDVGFRWGTIGTTLVPVRYLGLPGSDDQQLGLQLMISFWAWGDDESDTMLNLARLMTNLTRALRHMSAQARRAESVADGPDRGRGR